MTAKKYGNEDLYTMVTLALHYPKGGYGGNSFWKSMTELYGDSILKERIAGPLRERWRKIAKEHANDLENYKQVLAQSLPKEFIDNVEKVINTKLAERGSLLAGSKRHSSLLPNIFKDGNMGASGIENGESKKPITKRTRKKKQFSNVRIGSELESVRCIDMSQLTAKKSIGICKLLKKEGFNDIDSEVKSIFASKDLISEIAKMVRTVELGTSLPNLGTALGNNVKDKGEWTELENLALKHQDIPELQSCLIKMKGAEAVASHRKALGI